MKPLKEREKRERVSKLMSFLGKYEKTEQTEFENLKPVSGKPWTGICSKGCWYAKNKRCRCKCHKQNHGRGNKPPE